MAAEPPSKRAAQLFDHTQAAKRYTHFQTIEWDCYSDFLGVSKDVKKHSEKAAYEHAVREGVRFCLLQCAQRNSMFKLKQFKDATCPGKPALAKYVRTRASNFVRDAPISAQSGSAGHMPRSDAVIWTHDKQGPPSHMHSRLVTHFVRGTV